MSPCLLFDLDGTVVHTDHLHFEAFRELRARDGHTLTEAEFKAQILGRSNIEIFRDYFPAAPAVELTAMADAKEARVRAMIEAGPALLPTAGLLALLDWADAHDVHYAIVTNAPPANAVPMLRASGLEARFRVTVSGEALPHGKPHPLPYLEGLRLTGGDPRRAFAFEDSLAGLQAAIAAGLPCAGMGTGLPPQTLLDAGALLVARDFTDQALFTAIHKALAPR